MLNLQSERSENVKCAKGLLGPTLTWKGVFASMNGESQFRGPSVVGQRSTDTTELL